MKITLNSLQYDKVNQQQGTALTLVFTKTHFTPFSAFYVRIKSKYFTFITFTSL